MTILTLLAEVESVLKYNSATPFVTKLNLYWDVLPGARKPLSQTVLEPLELAKYDAMLISEYWAFADGWAVAKLLDDVVIPLSSISVIPLFPE